MGPRVTSIFPFAIAMVLPPAGLLMGALEFRQDRELGVRLIVTALLAGVVWTLLFII